VTQSDDAAGCRGEFGGGTLLAYVQNGYPVAMSCLDERAALAGCSRCGYLRFDPLPEAAFLERYYADQYWDAAAIRQMAEAEYEYPGYRLQTAEILRAWTQYGGATRSPRVHDIGCGVGTLVHHLRQQGINATGSDLSKPAIATGHALGNAALFCSSLTEFLQARPSEQIDLFVMSHVFEHVREPIETLRELRAHLPRDGVLWLRVPNGLYQLARGRSWYDFPWLQYPNHIHYFTPRSLRCCLAAGGFGLAEVGATTREDNPALLFADLLGRAGDTLVRRDALLDGLAKNLLTQELQAIAAIAGSPRLPPETASSVDALEPPGCNQARSERRQPVQHSAEFSTISQGRYGWSYQWSAFEPERFVDMTALQDGMVWLGPDGSQIGWSWILLKPGSRLRLARRSPGTGPLRVRCTTRIYEGEPTESYWVRISVGARICVEQQVMHYQSRAIDRVIEGGEGAPVNFDFWTGGAGYRRILVGLAVECLDAGSSDRVGLTD
jgi:2-polyprenyl-3-methyl-5-hydroxy-6-metoxy-1,4-benzoquinol methylase